MPVPAVLRLLLPLIAALALVATPLASWAAVELPETSCCCPDPELCNCDDDGSGAPAIERCSRSVGDLALPALLAAVLVSPPALGATDVVEASEPPAAPILRERAPERPEKPPS